MPTYDSVCKTCGAHYEYSAKVAVRDTTPVCCNSNTERKLVKAPQGYVDKPAFMSNYKHLY